MYDNFKMLEGYYGDRNAAFKAVAFKGVSDFLKYQAIDYLQSGWTRAGEAAEKAKSEFENANS